MKTRPVLKVINYVLLVSLIAAILLFWLMVQLEVKFALDPTQEDAVFDTGLRIAGLTDLFCGIFLLIAAVLLVLNIVRDVKELRSRKPGDF